MKAKTEALAALFVDSRTVEHPGGHFTPGHWPLADIMDFIVAHVEADDLETLATSLAAKPLSGFTTKMNASLEFHMRRNEKELGDKGIGREGLVLFPIGLSSKT